MKTHFAGMSYVKDNEERKEKDEKNERQKEEKWMVFRLEMSVTIGIKLNVDLYCLFANSELSCIVSEP